MKNPLFRQAVPEDIPRILEIIRQARRRMAAAGSRQWQDGYPAPANIASDVEQGYGHVICRATIPTEECVEKPDDKTAAAKKEPREPEMRAPIVAYGAIVFDGEPAYNALEGQWITDENYVVVHRLAVADEALGQGLGLEFLRLTEQLARQRNIRAFRIDTSFDNRRMLRVLARSGFIRCGKVVYRSGEREAFEKRINRE